MIGLPEAQPIKLGNGMWTARLIIPVQCDAPGCRECMDVELERKSNCRWYDGKVTAYLENEDWSVPEENMAICPGCKEAAELDVA